MAQFSKVHNHLRRSAHLLSSQLLDVDQNLMENFALINHLFASVCRRLEENSMMLESAIDQLGIKTERNLFEIQNLFASTVSIIDDDLQEFQKRMDSSTNSIGQFIHDAHERTMDELKRIMSEVDIANENLQSIGIGKLKNNYAYSNNYEFFQINELFAKLHLKKLKIFTTKTFKVNFVF